MLIKFSFSVYFIVIIFLCVFILDSNTSLYFCADNPLFYFPKHSRWNCTDVKSWYLFCFSLTGLKYPSVFHVFILVSVFTCPTIFGFYPDAINCGQFYICSWSIPYHFDCPVGTVWNIELTVCDWPFNVNCGTRPWFGRVAFEKHFLPRQL